MRGRGRLREEYCKPKYILTLVHTHAFAVPALDLPIDCHLTAIPVSLSTGFTLTALF
jgi:hypothetical protein